MRWRKTPWGSYRRKTVIFHGLTEAKEMTPNETKGTFVPRQKEAHLMHQLRSGDFFLAASTLTFQACCSLARCAACRFFCLTVRVFALAPSQKIIAVLMLLISYSVGVYATDMFARFDLPAPLRTKL